MTKPGGDWVFSEDAKLSPLCACGHPKSDHRTRFKLGKQPDRLACDARDEATGKPGRMRAAWCKCQWFRLALGQEAPADG